MKYEDMIGIPFKEGGRDLSGLDCVGIILVLLKRLGKYVPEYESCFDEYKKHVLIMDEIAKRCTPLAGPEPLCIVTFWKDNPDYTSHLGMVLENGYEFIHCPRNAGVVVQRLDAEPWKRKITGFYRYEG